MTSNYRTALYDSYVGGHQGVLSEQRNQARMAVDVLRHLPRDPRAKILDIGCGQGMLIRFLLDHGYQSVSGIDLSPDQIALAQKLGTPDVTHANLFDVAQARPGVYDAVIALDVVEHFDRKDAQSVFAAFSRLLRPRGVVILRTPNGCSPYSGRLQFSDLTHGVIYTNRSLQQLSAISGLTDVRVFPVRPAGSGSLQRVRRLLWAIIETAMIVPLVVETGNYRGHVVTQNLVYTATKDPD